MFSDCQTGKQPCRQERNLLRNLAPCLPVSNYRRRRTKTRRGFIEQFYASTEEKESVARPSVHSQTLSSGQGQRRELTDSYSGVLGLREAKKGLPADRLVVKLESTTDSSILMCFISKSSCYPTKEKPRVCNRVNLLQPRRYYISCLRSNRSMDRLA